MGDDQGGQSSEMPEPQPDAAQADQPGRGGSVRRRLSDLRSGLTILRKVIVDLAAVGGAVAVIAVFVLMVTDDTIVIEAPSVPKPVSDRGLTPELLTDLLQARINEIQDTAKTSKLPETAGPGLETVSIETAGLNFSLNSLARMARRILGFGRERVLKMRVICATPDCEDDGLELHAVSYAGDVVSSTAIGLETLAKDNLDQAMKSASHYFLRSFDPTLLAIDHYRQGTHHLRQENLTEARENLKIAKDMAKEMVLGRHPQAVWAYNLLGLIEMTCLHFDVAKAYFEEALILDQKFVPAIVNIGSIHVRTDDDPSAIKAYKRALAVDRDNVFAHANLGKISIRRGEWAEATEAYERAFEIDPGISSVLSGLAEVKEHYGEEARATALARLAEPSNAKQGKEGPSLRAVVEYSAYCSSGG